MNKYLRVFLFTIVVSGITAFVVRQLENDSSTLVVVNEADKGEADAYNRHAVDSAISILRSGNIVVRTGFGADSYLLTQMNLKDKTWSHCGIVMIENGYPFVYHSIGGEDNPDQRMRRDSASFFFSPVHNMGFGIVGYDFTNDGVDQLRKEVANYYRQRPKFDMKFDLKTDDKLYCAEMIYKSVNRAMNDSLYIKPSHALGYTFVGIDDLFLNPHAHMIWQVKFK